MNEYKVRFKHGNTEFVIADSVLLDYDSGHYAFKAGDRTVCMVPTGEVQFISLVREVQPEKTTYQDGDIGIIFHGDGVYFIGAYDSKRDKFYANDAPWKTTAEFGADSTYEITIIGNVKDYA